MADFELFNGTELEEPDADHRIALNKKSLAGAFFVRWDAFKNLLRGFLVSKDTDQSISGNKTFTGIVNVQAPTSDNNPVTLKYFNDNAGGGEEIIEVATYADLPLVGVISVLYVVLDENVQYRWSGTVYVPMSNPLSYASQGEMELAEPTENTKVVTPLRAWQGFMYWCTTSVFAGLSTTTKTIIGAINELKTNITTLFASIRTKQDVNVGFCELCPVLTSDVTRDWSTRTLTIQSTKGGTTVDATNPIRFFTKTSGAKKEWEKTTAQSVQWTDTKGLKYIYFDADGVLKSQDTPWVISDITLVWRLYWNPAEVGVKKIVREAWECHTNSISSSDHVWKHKFGAIYLRGLDLVCNVIPTGAPNADGRNTCLSLTSGSCVDDNLQYDILNSATPADFSQDMGVVVASSLTLLNGGIFDITYNAPDGTLTIIGGTRIPFHFVGNVPQVISSGGIITPVTNNYFFNYYLYTFQDPRFGKVVSLRSGGQYATQALANAETWEQVKAASPTLQDGEVRQLYQSQWEYRTSYDIAVKGAALRGFKTLRENAAVSVTAGSSSLLASNVVLTPPTGYASSTNVQIYADENAARVVKLESDETPAAINDADNVRFKSGTGYYVRTLLAIKNYVKSGLKASEVINDSTLDGDYIDDALNAAEAAEVSDLLPTDLIPAQRFGVGNVMIPHSLFGQTSDGTAFVADGLGLTNALAAEKETMQICATAGITMSSISNVYAGNVLVTGRKITISGGLSLLNSSSSRSVTRLVFDAAINFTGDNGDGTYVITATDGIWHLTFRNLTSAKPIKIFATAGAEIHITTRKQLTVDAGSTGTYSLSTDSSLDIIDDDIIVNTNIVIGATYAGPYVIANVPDNYLVDSIEITDVTLTAFSLIPEFETSTDTYTSIAGSQQRVTDKSIYIYNNKPIQTGIGLINNTKTLGVYVLNSYGEARRLVLSDFSGGWTNSTVNVKVVLKENK